MVTVVDRGRWTCAPGRATRPGRRSPRCGPASWAAHRSSSATGSGSWATCPAPPDTLARIVRVEERTTVLRRTADDTDPVERVVVANAEQLVIVTAVADPEPRTGLRRPLPGRGVRRRPHARAVPHQGRPRRPRAVRRRRTASWSCRWSSPAATGRPTRSRTCSPGRSRRWSGTPGWASPRWSTRSSRTRRGPSGVVVGRRQGPPHDGRGDRPAAPGRPRLGGRHPGRAVVRARPRHPGRRARPRSTTSPAAIEDCPRGCGHLGPPADPECALDALVERGKLRPARLAALRRVLVALRST